MLRNSSHHSSTLEAISCHIAPAIPIPHSTLKEDLRVSK